MNIGTILADATGVLPFIQVIVSGIESLFGGGNGGSKLQAATSATVAALQSYAALAGKTLPASIEADLQAAINANVKIMNDLGLLLPAGSPSNVPPAKAA